MKAIKVLATVFLGGLLFIALLLLGAGVTVQATALNPDFVVRQTDRLDLPALTRNFIEDEFSLTSQEDEFVREAALRIVAAQEPWLKEQAAGAVRAGYDYLLGRANGLNITVPLVELKQDLRDSAWEIITEDPAAWFPLFQDELNAYIDRNFAALVQQIKQQLPAPLSALPVEALEPQFEAYLLEIEGQIIAGELPPADYALLLAVARPYFNDYYDDIASQVPDEISVDSGAIPEETMSALMTVREYVGYFRTGFYLLIVLAVVLAAGIVLLNLGVRAACLALGVILALAGGLELGGVLFARGLAPLDFPGGLPAPAEAWLNGLYMDTLTVTLVFGIVVLGTGVILLALSLFSRFRVAAD